MNADLGALSVAAVSIGFFHTLLGPDHYVPFVAMSRLGGWSRRKTLVVTLLCGVAHVGSSVLLGFIGLALGLIVFQLETSVEPATKIERTEVRLADDSPLQKIETGRGDVAGWLFIGFGLAYLAWGLVRAVRSRSHTHLHTHADGTMHAHEHAHMAEHLHPHAAGTSMTPWILFAVFAFGPCEPLIPLAMYPAAKGDLLNAACVIALFALTTLITMTGVVFLMSAGVSAVKFAKLDRYSHALAGLVLLSCGVAIKAGL
ncbi:MAG: hypothetical protein B7Z73_11475 [Planctomycetia bacterium 21-64-5]|nr:MAG: hypothetical protein B7Z73_11475 [Planctomycetia bacterium 21-64-5]HQU42360.1 hypothetical protein [Pirellulales bacterium]